jgi:hypothetical protein
MHRTTRLASGPCTLARIHSAAFHVRTRIGERPIRRERGTGHRSQGIGSTTRGRPDPARGTTSMSDLQRTVGPGFTRNGRGHAAHTCGAKPSVRREGTIIHIRVDISRGLIERGDAAFIIEHRHRAIGTGIGVPTRRRAFAMHSFAILWMFSPRSAGGPVPPRAGERAHAESPRAAVSSSLKFRRASAGAHQRHGNGATGWVVRRELLLLQTRPDHQHAAR